MLEAGYNRDCITSKRCGKVNKQLGSEMLSSGCLEQATQGSNAFRRE